ncbi:MAG: hypothetical protein CTY31_10020 [Hyphomicrobium sp.]|nr:MAG: hypothetical protein CTY31_10020 [Hyphomicrobium sp.]
MTLKRITTSSIVSSVSLSVLALSLVSLMSAEAGAVSSRAKIACAKDYYAHCRAFSPNSPETRQCMRSLGAKLSARCMTALAAEGEVSERDMERYAQANGWR